MDTTNQSRRKLLGTGAALLTTPLLSPLAGAASVANSQPYIATNTYPWGTFAQRSGQPFQLHTSPLLAAIASTGIQGYEPIIESAAELAELGTQLENHALQMRSLYVNSVLHDAALVEQSIDRVVAIASAAHALGTRIVVTNPAPIRWGGKEGKSDHQLRLQARSLDRLGAQLRKLGMALAYHNHDAELLYGAREFHHMLTATDPENVKFCLDAHWIFRGCGNSEVAVLDTLSHYSQRIVELHLRQSTGGVWSESFAMTGDIDYHQIFEFLDSRQITPHLVLEQAVEAQSPNQLSGVEAHRASYEALRATISTR